MKQNRYQIRELTLENGISFPSDEELIMLILGSGTKTFPIDKLSKKILSVLMSNNSENIIKELMKLNGVKENKALTIAASIELGRRLSRTPQVVLTEPKDIIPFIQNYAMQSQEHFLCVNLNGAREIISIRVVCVGSGNMAILRPSEIFKSAIKENASAIVISHNHPSGNPTPSKDDVATTNSLIEAAKILGIALLDHIIIAQSSYFSFLEHDMI